MSKTKEGIRFSPEAFKTKIVSTEDQTIDQKELSSYLKTFYDCDSAYPLKEPYPIKTIQDQAYKICDYMSSLGMTKFAYLKDKFSTAPSGADNAKIMYGIKETMEAIMYKMDHSKIGAKELSAQYSERDFVCKEGTLTNLQCILEDLSLEGSDIDAYVADQKKTFISQVAADMNRSKQFKELWSFSFM